MNQKRNADQSDQGVSRRRMLQRTAGLAAASGIGLGAAGCETTTRGRNNPSPNISGPAVQRGRINQSIVQWCFEAFGEEWELEETARVANRLGVRSIELLSTEQLPVIARHDLICAITSIDMPGDDFPFIRGWNNPAHHEQLINETRRCIDQAARYNSPNVIAFVGYSHKDVDNMGPDSEHWTDAEALENCVQGLKQVVDYAEEKQVTICMEHLNTRDDSHPMKGHPGYQGDDLDLCLEICRQVDSPRMKLLFDIYHVQIMHGDVIRRLHECDGYIGHIHTAGNPGRGELDNTQEINYPPIMRTLLELGYDGYVGQEFIPTRDPYQGLHEAISLCDV